MLDGMGRLVIPKEYRVMAGIDNGEPAKITIEDRRIIIEQAEPACRLCGSTERVNDEFLLCEKCINAVKAL